MTKNAQATTTSNKSTNNSACTDSSCCPSQSPVVRSAAKVGRNDPCPCGNGKKFKKCCGSA